MTIGVCMDLTAEGMRERFESTAKYGFRQVQLIAWDPSLWTDEKAAEINALVKETGVEITAFWSGWSGPKFWNFTEGPQTLGLVPVEYRNNRVQDLINGAAFARRLGVKDVVSHMGFIPSNPSDPLYPGFVAAVKAVALDLKRHDQYLNFETGQETPVTLLRLFEDVGLDNLFINLDPANLILYGMGNPVDALDVFGKYIRGVHAKDGLYPTNGRQLGKQVKVGAGRVDFPRLIARLKEVGFDGPLTIEREISGEQQIIDILETKTSLEELLAC